MAAHFRSYTAIEKKPAFMGIALQDILLVTALFVAFLLLGALIMVIGLFMPIYFASVLAGYIIAIILLFKLKPKGQPDFFIAFISFHWKQPVSIIIGKRTHATLLIKRP